MRKSRDCKNCGVSFIPGNGQQVYCGSKSDRVGCSWRMVAVRDKARAKLPHRKKQILELQKDWKKKQRAMDTDYAKRQRELKKKYNKTEHGRIIARISNKRNIKTKLACNRRRMIAKKGVIGSHTHTEWTRLLKRLDYKCVECGVLEQDLLSKYGSKWAKLTRDHVIPISRGGTDYIENIQPLCVGCNAKKHNKILIRDKIVIVSGHFNPMHVGHIDYINNAAKYGKVWVLLNSDKASVIKHGFSFMSWDERYKILSEVRGVSMVLPVDDHDGTVIKGIEYVHGLGVDCIFAKGGDRGISNTPERDVCDRLGIEMIFGCGGEKYQSSSALMKKCLEHINDWRD